MRPGPERLLAFDTSGECLSAAFLRRGQLVRSVAQPFEARHSENLAPTLDALLKAVRCTPEKLDLVAVSLGPGSFTGLRVGVTAAKILAYATRAALVGVSVLEAEAEGMEAEGRVLVVRPARRGNAYAAVFEKRGARVSVKVPPSLVSEERLASWLSGCTHAAGADSDWLRSRLSLDNGAAVHILEKSAPEDLARRIGAAAWRRFREGKTDLPGTLEPLYLYPRDCNVTPPKKKMLPEGMFR